MLAAILGAEVGIVAQGAQSHKAMIGLGDSGNLLAGVTQLHGFQSGFSQTGSLSLTELKIGALMEMDFPADQANLDSSSVSISSLLSSTRSSTGWAAQADGTLSKFNPNELRITDKGLLIEEARTNYQTYSEDFPFGWDNGNVTYTLNDEIAPDGYMTADKLAFSGWGQKNGTQITPFPGTTFVFSIFVKDGGATGVLTLQFSGAPNWVGGIAPFLHYNTGTETINGSTNIKASEVVDYANGWKRVWFSAVTGPSTSGTITPYISATDINIHLWGRMVEIGDFPTSYIKTAGAAATRAADNVQFSDMSWLNEAKGTILTEFIPLGGDGGYPVFALQKAGSLGILLKMDKRSNGKFGTAIYNGGTQYYREGGLYVEGQTVKLACAFQGDNVNSSVDGSVGSTDTNATLPIGIDTLRLGQNEYAVSTGACLIKAITYWPERKTNIEVEGLTA